MKKNLVITLLSLVGLNAIQLKAQGCSDAGICTIEGIKPIAEQGGDAAASNTFKVAAYFGKADHSITTWGNYLEFHHRLADKFGLSAKLTTLAQNGNEISVLGISDLFVAGDISLSQHFKFTLGLKIPLSDGNKQEESLPLPMDYQASLGTTDLLLGLGFHKNRFQLALAYQQPVSQNENGFLASLYPANSPLNKFQSTKGFERSADIMLRASYVLNLGQKWNWIPGLLPIFHTSNDQFTDEQDKVHEIEGSSGLTLNLNSFFDFSINEKSSLQLGVAFPLVVRDTRPDGLTRSFVSHLEYRYSF